MVEEGTSAPSFCLMDCSEREICVDDFRKKWIVLYFYPKDGTSGCTIEALEFSDLLPEFEERNTVIIGVSPDSCESHRRFIERNGLGLILLSDPEKLVLEPYGAWRKKKSRGREHLGVVRSTVLIDPDGIVRKTWDNVRPAGHAEHVLETLDEILKPS